MKSCNRALALSFLSLLVVFSSGATVRAETLLCLEEAAGGLKFFDGNWIGVKFKTGSIQYVVTAKASDPAQYEVKEVGKDYPLFTCEREKLIDGSAARQMGCGGMGYGMLINFEKLRWVGIYTYGYIEDDKSGENTPSVTGGKCSVVIP